MGPPTSDGGREGGWGGGSGARYVLCHDVFARYDLTPTGHGHLIIFFALLRVLSLYRSSILAVPFTAFTS